MSVPIQVDIVDIVTDAVVATHAAYPNEDGSLCLTGIIDLPVGSYNFKVRLSAIDPLIPVRWAGGAFQMIVGQTVTEINCPGEPVG